LDFSKIEAGKLDIISAPYSLASLINDSVQLNLMKLESKPIEFEVNVCENVPANLIGDEIRIKQILNNLLSNAFKYTDSGKIALSVDYSPILEEDNEIILLLKVEDSGRGMSEEQINKLFVEYMRFNGEENNKIEGTGLGLTITQRLISLMGGKIHVESEKDKGSLFTINLPQRTKDNEILGKEVAENLRLFRTKNVLQNIRCQVTREAMPYGSVLVVDDVETNLYVAIGLMKPYELQIDTASSGKEAIEKIKEGKVYDIIFMDHMMPEMDGMEATKIIREFGYKAAIVALTANAVVGQVDIFLKNGFDEFISKPVDVRRLNTILNRFIRDKQSPEVIEAVRLRKSNEDSKNTSVQIDSMMLESFIKDARKAVAVLEELYQKNELESNADDLRRFTTFVHGIKSSLWNIGEKELSKAASELEAEARKNNINLLILKTPKFLNELRSLSEKLEAEYAASLSLADKPIFSDKKINGLDIEKGLKKYNNDEKSYLGIIRSYAATMRSMFDILENVSEKNLHDYGIKVHGIKGSSRDIFADETGEIAAGLEIAAKAEDFDYIKEHNPVLLENVRRLVGDLEALITAIDLQNPKPKKIKPSPEVLTKLLAACKMYDMDSGDEAMDELEEFSYEEDSELVEWLRDKFDMTRFDEIAERLSNEINK
jgi:CheY-like chemotaxis protein